MTKDEKSLLEKEFLIPYEIKVRADDIKEKTNSLYNVNLSGSIVPKEYYLHEFKEDSQIYNCGKKIIKDIKLNTDKYNLLYIPNKEWYSIFKIVRYKN